MKKLDMNDIERRVQRSFYQDGLLEIMTGIYLFLVGTMLSETFTIAFLPLLIFGYRPIAEAAKRKYIYPRIGYVKFREEVSTDSKSFARGLITILAIAVASPFVSILILGKGPGWEFWTRRFLPFYTGFMTSIGLIYAAGKYRVFRYYVFAAVCVAAGLGVPFLGLESIYEPIGIEFMIIGGVLFVTGLVMFLAFLAKYPVDKRPGEGFNESG